MSKEKEIPEKRQSTHEELTDMVVEGFKRLDNNILDKRPPKIVWMEGFEKKEDKVKIEYLKKLASTMNNAARLIQDERDELARLMALKEAQLEKLSEQLSMNNLMLQDQVTKMNEQRQGYITEVSRLSRKIRELEAKEIENRKKERLAKKEEDKDR